MFCPLCKCEYRQGFTTCADCDVALVAKLPSNPTPEANSETEPERTHATLIPVFETYNQPDMVIIKSELDAAGIIYHFSGESFHMMGVRPLPTRLLVASDQREDVLAILRNLAFID
jgi:hypothetical protein